MADVSYVPGPRIAVAGEQCWALAETPPDAPAVARTWQQVGQGAAPDVLLAGLVADGIADTPGFTLLAAGADGRYRLFCRGTVGATVVAPSGDGAGGGSDGGGGLTDGAMPVNGGTSYRIDGAGLLTWREQLVPADAERIFLGAPPADTELRLPAASGVLLAGCVIVDLTSLATRETVPYGSGWQAEETRHDTGLLDGFAGHPAPAAVPATAGGKQKTIVYFPDTITITHPGSLAGQSQGAAGVSGTAGVAGVAGAAGASGAAGAAVAAAAAVARGAAGAAGQGWPEGSAPVTAQGPAVPAMPGPPGLSGPFGLSGPPGSNGLNGPSGLGGPGVASVAPEGTVEVLPAGLPGAAGQRPAPQLAAGPQAPVQHAPAQHAPAQQAPGQLAPVQQAPVQQPPGQQASAYPAAGPASVGRGASAPGVSAPGVSGPGLSGPAPVSPGVNQAPQSQAPGGPAGVNSGVVPPGAAHPGVLHPGVVGPVSWPGAGPGRAGEYELAAGPPPARTVADVPLRFAPGPGRPGRQADPGAPAGHLPPDGGPPWGNGLAGQGGPVPYPEVPPSAQPWPGSAGSAGSAGQAGPGRPWEPPAGPPRPWEPAAGQRQPWEPDGPGRPVTAPPPPERAAPPAAGLIDVPPWLAGSGGPGVPGASGVPGPGGDPFTAAPDPLAPLPASLAPTGLAPARLAPLPGPADAGLGEADPTVHRGELAELAARTAPPDRIGPVVPALICPSGHVNPPNGTACRRCGTALPHDPVLVPRPVLGVLRLSLGDVIALDRGVVMGRNPRTDFAGAHGEERPHVVKLPSADGDISRTHLRVSLDGWHVLVTDLNSTNGTLVTLPGHDPQQLRPGEPVPIQPGTVVTLADGIDFRYEVAE